MTDKRYYWATITKPVIGFGVVVQDNVVTEIGEPMVQYLEGWYWNRARFHLRKRGLTYVEVPRTEIEYTAPGAPVIVAPQESATTTEGSA